MTTGELHPYVTTHARFTEHPVIQETNFSTHPVYQETHLLRQLPIKEYHTPTRITHSNSFQENYYASDHIFKQENIHPQ